jgi:hypothetical protein
MAMTTKQITAINVLIVFSAYFPRIMRALCWAINSPKMARRRTVERAVIATSFG